MATGEAAVFGQQEGSGYAQIFGRAGDPLKAIYTQNARNDRNLAMLQERNQQQRASRDKAVSELLDYDAPKTFEPFAVQRDAELQKVRDKIKGDVMSGRPIDSHYLTENAGLFDKVENVAARGNYLEKLVTNKRQQVKDNKYLNKDYYDAKINDFYMDEKGNGKPMDQIDMRALDNLVENDPMGFDGRGFMRDFMKDPKKNIYNYVTNRATANGSEVRDIKIKLDRDILTPDPEDPQGIKRNPDGTPVINITDDVQNAIFDNPNAERYFNAIAKQQNRPVKEVLKEYISPETTAEKDEVLRQKDPSKWMYDEMLKAANGGFHPSEIPMYTGRHKSIVDMINGVNKDGTVTAAAQAAAGKLGKNVKFGNGNITASQIIPGTNTPGNSTVFGRVVQNSAHPRLVFEIRYGGKNPRVETEEVALDDPGAYGQINGMLNSAKSEGKDNISTDQLLKFANVTPESVYAGKAEDVARADEMKANENKAVTGLLDGTEKNLDEYHGVMLDGQRIKKVKRVLNPAWDRIVNRKPYHLEAEMEDGSKKDLNDYDDVAKLIRNKKDNDMVNVIGPNGKPGKMTRANYKKAVKDGAGFKLAK